jgi:fumarate reductase subunit C
MDGWWRKNPFFVRYMIREATAVFVLIYAAILLITVVRLTEGAQSFERWMAFLRSPASIALHVVLLVAFLYHTKSWFDIMPKTMPPVVVGGKRLSAAAITWSGLVASAVLSVAMLVFFLVLA